MCRLYGMRATHPTEMECELLEAQNSLLRQSVKDSRGLDNPHGWGIGYITPEHTVHLQRQVMPAYQSEAYRKEAAWVRAMTAIAHIRRATVGHPAAVNTHPFAAEGSLFAHNGDIGPFEVLRERLLDAMSQPERDGILGQTDSEHFFHLLLSRSHAQPEEAPEKILADAARDVVTWSRDADGADEVFLNTLWAAGDHLCGTRHRRTLWYLVRRGASPCPACGEYHTPPDAGDDYRCVVLASERITSENWREVPDHSVFRVTDDFDIEFTALNL